MSDDVKQPWAQRITPEIYDVLVLGNIPEAIKEIQERVEKLEDLWRELAESRQREVVLVDRVKTLEDAIRWALGEGDSDFGNNKPENAKPFWWRKELRKRVALQALAAKEPRA